MLAKEIPHLVERALDDPPDLRVDESAGVLGGPVRAGGRGPRVVSVSRRLSNSPPVAIPQQRSFSAARARTTTSISIMVRGRAAAVRAGRRRNRFELPSLAAAGAGT
jgi:hypothetical protein